MQREAAPSAGGLPRRAPFWVGVSPRLHHPPHAGRWLGDAPGDEDLFLEEIPFDQTRAYVKLVTENLNVYQALYDGSPASAPVLPR